ncbi:hypothetical protein AZF37_02850 [endosymbiont 'TC1' of Trimyema compressum]|nr:hypothetical protein AZF37_02850 [endosymbiont 'TC1' of Trimyema compressum]
MLAMKELLKEPEDEVLVFTLPSTLSGTYEEAVSAAATVDKKRFMLLTQELLYLKVVWLFRPMKWFKKGSVQKKLLIILIINQDNIDTFEFLRKGGRIGYAQSVVGGLLNIKPILKYNEEGKLVPWYKEKGTKKACQKIANYVKENRTNDYLMISHADNEKGANELATMIEEITGEKPFIIAPMSAVIGTHTGPGCLFASY